MLIRLSKSIVGKEEAQAVERVICGNSYLGMGEEVDQFEKEIATFLGVPREWVVCVNTGTSALHLAIEAVTEPGDEVLVQSLTYVACFQAISGARAVPVPCEVRPETITIDLDDAANRISPRTKAIMPVHYASNPGNLDAIYAFARSNGLRVIEDAAHAFGCRYDGRRIGSFGDVVCFSFDGIKNITSGEGGAVVTSDSRVAQRVRDARLLGVHGDTENRFSGGRSWEFDVEHQGYRYHMSNVMAAIGRVQLRRFEHEFAPRRVELAVCYHDRLVGVGGVNLLDTDLSEVIPHIQPVRVTNERRDVLRVHLKEKGIETGIHYMPNHLLSYYGGGQMNLPVTESLYKEILSLPLHPMLSLSDVDMVCNVIEEHLAGVRNIL